MFHHVSPFGVYKHMFVPFSERLLSTPKQRQLRMLHRAEDQKRSTL
jgi:hypothetical protein